jgi:hypothetical protein
VSQIARRHYRGRPDAPQAHGPTITRSCYAPSAPSASLHLRRRALKRQLRLITPDAWRSPAAHLPGARKAATQAAYINGLLVLLSLGAAGYLLVKGVGWGAYGNSFGFGALMLAVFIPPPVLDFARTGGTPMAWASAPRRRSRSCSR